MFGQVEEQIERLVGRPLAELGAAEFEIRVRQLRSSWSLELSTRLSEREPARVREITGKTCGEVTDAAAVAIALATNELEDKSQPTARQPAAQPAPVPSAPRASNPPAPKAKQSPDNPFGVTSNLAALVDVGALPNPDVGAQLELWLGSKRLRAGAYGALLAPERTSVPTGAGGEFELFFGGLALLAAREFGPWSAHALIGSELGSLSGEGRDVTRPHRHSELWWALQGGVGGARKLGSAFALFGRASLVLPLRRPEFVLNQRETVHRPAGLEGRGVLGVELSW